MKVKKIETIYIDEFPNLLWVHVISDDGSFGLGETFFGAGAVEAHIHEFIAPYLIGKNPFEIERHSSRLTGYVGRGGSGAEMRGASAVDIALWDLWGKALKRPIFELLGGKSRDKIRVYNTCAGYKYVRKAPAQTIDNFGLNNSFGPFEDLGGFLNTPDKLAESLIDMGIKAMKIWPFDFAAEASGGNFISTEDLKSALYPFERIREIVGDKIEIMAELHSLWNVPMAKKICDALAEFSPTWIEDPVRMDHPDSVSKVCLSTHLPIAGGELLGQRTQFRQLVEQTDISLVIMDLVWGGGLTEARKIASMCDTWGIPFAAHDCTGPVALAASTHMALHAPNIFIQEIVRAFYFGWYKDLVTELPPLKDGFIEAPNGRGLGLELSPSLFKRSDIRIRTTNSSDI